MKYDRGEAENGKHKKQGRIEEEDNQLYRRPQIRDKPGMKKIISYTGDPRWRDKPGMKKIISWRPQMTGQARDEEDNQLYRRPQIRDKPGMKKIISYTGDPRWRDKPGMKKIISYIGDPRYGTSQGWRR